MAMAAPVAGSLMFITLAVESFLAYWTLVDPVSRIVDIGRRSTRRAGRHPLGSGSMTDSDQNARVNGRRRQHIAPKGDRPRRIDRHIAYFGDRITTPVQTDRVAEPGAPPTRPLGAARASRPASCP